MTKARWQCGPAGTTRDDPLEAIERGVGLSLARISGGDVDVFDVAEVLEPLLRAQLAHLDEDTRAVLDQRPGHEAHVAALLRRAIETREEVIAIADRERRARFVLDRARRLEANSIAADGVRLGARRQIEKARRRGAEARAHAFRLEALAHLARPGSLPIEAERGLRAALDAALWAETWERLAALDESLPSDVVLTWREVRAELSAELDRRFTPPRPEGEAEAAPQKTAPRPPATTPLGRPHSPAIAGWVAWLLAGNVGPMPATKPEGEADNRGQQDDDQQDSAPASLPPEATGQGDHQPSWLKPSGHPLSVSRLEADSSFALVLRTLSGALAPPTAGPENAWCALCGMSYELPEGTPVFQTSCGVCRHTLIPCRGEPLSRMRCDFAARCTHCGHRFRQTTTHRHHRCAACGTAVAPVTER